MSKSKHTAEWKISIVKKYLSGEGSFEALAEANGTSEKTLRRWVFQYQKHGEAGFYDRCGNKHYSKEFKKQCVESYLRGEGSLEQVVAKYNISSDSVLREWIKCYNLKLRTPRNPNFLIENPK